MFVMVSYTLRTFGHVLLRRYFCHTNFCPIILDAKSLERNSVTGKGTNVVRDTVITGKLLHTDVVFVTRSESPELHRGVGGVPLLAL